MSAIGDFQPGDKVVCVSILQTCPICGYTTGQSHSQFPVIGRYYTVATVCKGISEGCGHILPCFQPVGQDLGQWVWPQQDFRKIEPGESLADLIARHTSKEKELT